MRHEQSNPSRRDDRSRRRYYEEETRQDYYDTGYVGERLPYPDAAAAQLKLHHERDRFEQQQQINHRGRLNGIPQYIDQDMEYYERMIQQQDRRLQDEAQRYSELYQEVFPPTSRTPNGMRATTERTRGTTMTTTERTPATRTQTQTSESRSTSGYGSSGSYSSDSYYEDDNWEENIISAIHDMAGNLKDMAGNVKKIGGIHCNQAGPDSTEVQLKLNLPVPIHNLNLNSAMATLSPKKCSMQYEYDNMPKNCTNQVNPVYKSLFESQSETSSSDEDFDEDEQSQSTYEDPRFLQKSSRQPKQDRRREITEKSRTVKKPAIDTSFITHNVDGIPSHVLISEQPSGVSSSDSWLMLSPRNKMEDPQSKFVMNKINENLDNAIQNKKEQREPGWIPATKQRLTLEDDQPSFDEARNEPEQPKTNKGRSRTKDMSSRVEVPQVIECDPVSDGYRINESYSDLTFDKRKSKRAPKSEVENSNTQAPKEQSSAFERQSFEDAMKEPTTNASRIESVQKGTYFDHELDDLAEDKPHIPALDLPARDNATDGPILVPLTVDAPEDELVDSVRKAELEEERKQVEAWEQKKKKLEEERKRLEAEQKAEQEAMEEKRLEDERKKIEAEKKAKAEREALEAKRLKVERERREAEERARIEKEALEAKRLEEEKKRLEAEAKAKAAEEARQAKRMEEERKRREAKAKAKAEREALELKKLEDERKRKEDEAKAKKLEEERKQMELEAKAAREALEAKKLEEETRQREEEAKAKAEKEALEAKQAEEERQRIEAEAKVRAEEEAQEAKRVRDIRRRLEADAKAKKEAEMQGKSEGGMASADRNALYEMQGFDEYCKSLSTAHDDVTSYRTMKPMRSAFSDYDMYESENSKSERTASNSEKSGVSDRFDVDSSNSSEGNSQYSDGEERSNGSRSFDEQSETSESYDENHDGESDIYTESSSYEDDVDEEYEEEYVDGSISEHGPKSKIDIPSRNEKSDIKYLSERTRSVHFTLSSGATVNTTDKTRKPSAKQGKLKDVQTMSKLVTSSSYASEMPIALTATMSSLQTSDQGTVISANRSIGRFLPSDESVVTTTSFSHQSIMSAKPVGVSTTSASNERKENDEKSDLRSSILGSIISLILKLIFAIVVYLFIWIKHFAIMIVKKKPAKIDCTPTKFAMQPDKSVRREEIQDRSTDSHVHQKNMNPKQRAPYLLHDEPHREHTTLVVSPPVPPSYHADESDEVGTCVGSIVPDTHDEGKMSLWKINTVNTGMSSLTSPPSRSFGVLKKAYSALSSSKYEPEKCNWIDHDNIDDEVSYYE